MAHMLDMSNGRANMAYIGETPWHGLGTVMQPGATAEEWAEAAGMTWNAIKVPCGFQLGNEWVREPGQWKVIRDDTFAPLGQFTDRYKIVQPVQCIQFFDDFVKTDNRFTIETAGCLKGGAQVWALARFHERMDIMGEEHAPYVMLATSFDGSLATTAQATMIRVVCNNTLTASIYSKKAATVKIRHSTVWNDKAIRDAHKQLELVASTYGEYKALAEALALHRMTKEQTFDFFANLVGVDFDSEKVQEEGISQRKSNIIDTLMQCLETTEKECTEKGNAWSAFNAVTRFVDHERGTRRPIIGYNQTENAEGVMVDNKNSPIYYESEEQARMSSSFFGTGNAMKAKALELLTA